MGRAIPKSNSVRADYNIIMIDRGLGVFVSLELFSTDVVEKAALEVFCIVQFNSSINYFNMSSIVK